jgi:predicted Zn-dependent peptidase
MIARYHVTRLDNSLRVATAEMPSMQSVSLGVWVAVGGRHEPAPVCGVSHFIEHLLFKGTRRRSARQISQEVEGVGGYLNAFTSEEHTCYFAKASADKLGLLLDVLMDIYLEPVFDATELEKERGVIKEEIQMYLDRPDQHVHEILNETLWPRQPLGRPLTGSLKTMDAISRRDVLDYKARHYTGCNTIIAAAGPLDHARLLEAVRPLARRIREGRASRFSPARTVGRGPVVRLLTKQTEQSHLALGLHSFSRADERRYALKLLNVIFGENMSSRLFQVVRERHGMAYSIQSSLNYFADAGAMVISAGLDNKRLAKALRLTMREVARAAARPPSAGEMRRAKDYAIGQMRLALESTSNQMMWAGEHLLGFGKIFEPDEVVRHVHAVTASDVQAVARELFRANRLRMAVIGPTKDAKGIERELKQL